MNTTLPHSSLSKNTTLPHSSLNVLLWGPFHLMTTDGSMQSASSRATRCFGSVKLHLYYAIMWVTVSCRDSTGPWSDEQSQSKNLSILVISGWHVDLCCVTIPSVCLSSERKGLSTITAAPSSNHAFNTIMYCICLDYRNKHFVHRKP